MFRAELESESCAENGKEKRGAAEAPASQGSPSALLQHSPLLHQAAAPRFADCGETANAR